MVSSPIHDGIEGTDCGEVWISTGDDAIVILMPPYLEVLSSFLLMRHFFLFLASSSIFSVRYSWEIERRKGQARRGDSFMIRLCWSMTLQVEKGMLWAENLLVS